MAENTFKLFGFEITRTKDKKALASPVPPRDDDGAGYVTAPSAGSHTLDTHRSDLPRGMCASDTGC